MRHAYAAQRRFDCQSIEQLELNLNCRDEIIPVLVALQHVYCQTELRQLLIAEVARDVNDSTRNDVGREGLDYWQILVLAVVRLGCNLDYDKLQDLCENHRTLRCLLQVGDWSDCSFAARRIRDTLSLLSPATLQELNRLIVSYGQQLHGNAAQRVRADSFVIETNIHYPTESSLIWDGIRKICSVGPALAALLAQPGWRQTEHLRKKAKRLAHQVARISGSRDPARKAQLNPAYRELLEHARKMLDRAQTLEEYACQTLHPAQLSGAANVLLVQLSHWIELTVRVCDTAYRRTQLGEQVPNDDKLFSLFEPHTQLYCRGKAGEPQQFGRAAVIYEDAAGFISHYHLMERHATDSSVVCEQTQIAQERHRGAIKQASFDRGFYSAENQQTLSETISSLCLPPRHRGQYAQCMKEASVEFRQARKSHPGVESVIGALQCGNGLDRCRDRSEAGMERYLGLAILGRNLHVLGKLLIARSGEQTAAGLTRRQAS